MRLVLLILFFAGIPFHVIYAQFQPRDIVEAVDMLNLRARSENTKLEYKGSPYLNDEYLPGEIYYDDKWKYPDVLLRYNIYNDEFEYYYKEKNIAYAITPDPVFNKIIMGKDTFVVSSYYEKKDEHTGFFKLLAKGKATLLAKMEVEYEEAQPETAFLMAQPAEFHRKSDTYYLKQNGEPAVRIKKVKKVIGMMSDHQNELSAYLKDHKISSRDETELTELISYYNSL